MLELMEDILLAGCQQSGFKEYLDPHGNTLFAGHSNGSETFQLAQVRVGADKVPVSLIIYIHNIIYAIVYYIVYNIII